ncbi:DEAD/DEAH box helicase [Tolypothrix sp. PCC 7910]|uniref:DEAD/DEAH box helicase n=1 Tax=Tolypothrix sp. PCC 7910 TaxID=2099387 RepID=UPI001427787F|nr:DEAD/DEAH box helicase [Tolypothrix sp. PCC 7910]QIR36799.1 DEAD/DEAH box helicase [Tolypothrix sp. PCC 7910]
MTLVATFIGVNQYADNNIPDLAGASNDATALWALFSDSILDIKTHHLLNTQATGKAIRDALNNTFNEAGPDDTALFFFAGHGSPAHQLVPHDARCEALDETTIAMSELNNYLNSSNARIAIVILDCCFSGGATARVLQNVPTPRSIMMTIADLQGKGRVIIAASKDNEEAHELNGHGLLTQALLHTFKLHPTGIEIGRITDEVTQRVRSEASRFGFHQTPVIFNLTEGGLKLPPLNPGTRYAQAFPNTVGVKISSNIGDLAAFNLPSQLINAWKAQFVNGLNALQLKAVNEYRVLDHRSLLVVAPTSSGKTFIGEMAAAKAITQGKKTVFLLPFKSLTNEKYEDFQALYGEQLGLRVIRCTGDYSDNTDHFIRGKYDIALLTYEMFLGLSVSVPSLIHKIGLVILDEAQFITDPNRGIAVELLLTSLLNARKQGVKPQILALSAVIGDINYFNDWLECETLSSNERPVPLIEGVLDRNGVFQYIGLDQQEHVEQFLPPGAIVQRKSKPELQDIIVPLAKKLTADKEQLLIFRNQRGSAVGSALYLASELGLMPASNVLAQLPVHDRSTASSNLCTALTGGTAFHNSDLISEERLAVEQEFRQPQSTIRVLAATTTVAAGINTPSSTVIIPENFFYGDEKREFTVAEYKNMAGRAGRLGLSSSGRSILLAENAMERDRLFRRYVQGNPEPIRSSFDPAHTETWILRLLSQIKQIPKKEVIHLLASTYGGYLASRQHPDWHKVTEPRLEELLTKMNSLGLLEEDDEQIRLSLLGQACGKSNFSFSSALKLVDLLKRFPENLSAGQLMAYLQVLPEVAGYISVSKKGTKESSWAHEINTHYGDAVIAGFQRGAKDKFDYYGRCKRAAILWNWINGQPIETIENKFSVTPYAGHVGASDIRGCADRTRLYLQSAYDIVSLLLLGKGPDEIAINTILQQLEFGLPADALCLINLPVTLSRGEYLALYQAGYVTSKEVLQSLEKLPPLLSETRIKQLMVEM